MQNNPFGQLNDDGLEAARDVLGGGGVLESGVYDGTIVHAYAGASEGGARFLSIRIQCGSQTYNETIYVTNKQGENYYTKDGKKNPLPGFTTANDLALLSTGLPLSEQDFEEGVLKLYDFDAKQELPKKVMVAKSMQGKPITVAILKNNEDKTKKNDANGQYEPTGEFRDTNNIDKVFHSETGKTVSEFVGKKEAEFKGKWDEKNKGKTRQKAKGLDGKSGAPGRLGTPSSGNSSAPAGKGKSLFG